MISHRSLVEASAHIPTLHVDVFREHIYLLIYLKLNDTFFIPAVKIHCPNKLVLL